MSVLAPQPDRGPRRLASPGQRRRLVEGDLDRLADLELLDQPEVAPLVGLAVEQRAEQVGEDRHADDRRGQPAQAKLSRFRKRRRLTTSSVVSACRSS